MKKFFSVFLVTLCLNFNVTNAKAPIFTNILEEGFYSATDITQSLGNIEYVQNTSNKSDVYLVVLDKRRMPVKAIKMEPNSKKYILTPLSPDNKIIIIGDGEVFFS